MIAERVASVRDRIARAAARAGRAPDDVVLVAVSKTKPEQAVREAFAAGVRVFGENRVQEAEAKAKALEDLRASGLQWHLIGHLQANKAKKALAFEMVHSVDGAALGQRLARLAQEEGRTLRVLAQVDLAGEATKFGVPEPELFGTLESLKSEPSLRVEGLMVLPPYHDDPEKARPFFRRLRVLRDEARARGLLAGSVLSMGMSHDFEAAIEEGATHVRVGTGIFGEREKA